jgi:hypothetical protein
MLEFARGLKHCDRLRHFNFILWNNQITERGCQDLADNLCALKLTEL